MRPLYSRGESNPYPKIKSLLDYHYPTGALPEHYDWLNLLPITNLAPILALVMVKRANITAYIFV